MGQKTKKSLGILALFIMSCATGPCLNEMGKAQSTMGETQTQFKKNQISMAEREVPVQNRIWIYKEDGTLQCEDIKPIPLKTMADQLEKAGIRIFDSKNTPGGFYYPSACGFPKGQVNAFQINKKDLPMAQKLDFKEWVPPEP